ncbi:MAG: FHA domain-containing protein [Planctomycetes bacterium]|nr:FHA domain-containing protein [Planctomycetota bacterium]
MNMIECPTCKRSLPPDSRFCDACGGHLKPLEPAAPPDPPADAAAPLPTPPLLAGSTPPPPLSSNAGPGRSTRYEDRKEEVLVEVEMNKPYVQSQSSVLRFRATHISGQRHLNVTLELKIHFVKLENEERRVTFKLHPGDRQQVFTFSFKPENAGEHNVDLLRMTVEDLENLSDVMIYSMPHHGLLLNVNKPETPPTAVGVTIHGNVVAEYGAEVKLDVDRAAGKDPRRSGPSVYWEAIKLLLDTEESSRERERRKSGSRTPAAPRIVEAARREKMDRLRLSWSDGVREHRVFCLARSEAILGREDGSSDKGTRTDFVVRALPCRGPQVDPDNWARTSSISAVHALLRVDPAGHVSVTDLGSRQGTWLGDHRLVGGTTAPLGTDLATMALSEHVLELDVRVFRGSEAPTALELDPSVARGTGSGGGPNPAVGLEHAGAVDAVRLRRLRNAPEHTYAMVLRQATIGSNPDNPIWVPLPGVAPVHARLAYYRGEFFVADCEWDESETLADGRSLGPGEYFPLAPGSRITMGSTVVNVDAVRPADFKSI